MVRPIALFSLLLSLLASSVRADDVVSVRRESDFYVGGNVAAGVIKSASAFRLDADVRLSRTLNLDHRTTPLRLWSDNGSSLSSAGLPLTVESKGKSLILRPQNNAKVNSQFPQLGTFPILLINDEPREMMAYQNITGRADNFRNVTMNDGAVAHQFDFSWKDAQRSADMATLDEGSWLFVHVKWLTFRLRVVKKPQIDKHQRRARVTVTMTGDFGLPSLKEYEMYADVVNPNIPSDRLQTGTYIFHDQKIAYVPRPSDALNSLEARVVQQGTLLRIAKSKNISVKGITFKNNGTTDLSYESGTQAEGMTVSAIDIWHSFDVSFSHCYFKNLVGYCVAVDATKNDKQSTHRDDESARLLVSDCWVDSTYGGGFLLNNCHDCIIQNNSVTHFGRLQQGAVGITVRNAYNNDIRQNTVAYGPYTGISIGWSWRGDPTICRDNRVTFNYVHHCMQRLSDDGGGIYCMGNSPGTVIENNIVHDIYARNSGEACTMYFDEDCANVVFRGNICYNADRLIHFHFGHDVTIQDNLFAWPQVSGIWISLPQPGVSTFKATGNLFVIGRGTPLDISNQSSFQFASNQIFLVNHPDQPTAMRNLSRKTGNMVGTKNPLDGVLSLTENGVVRLNSSSSILNSPSFLKLLNNLSRCGCPHTAQRSK